MFPNFSFTFILQSLKARALETAEHFTESYKIQSKMLYGEWIIEGLGLHFSKIKWGWRAKLLGKHTLSKSSTGKIWDALSVVEDLMWKIDIYAVCWILSEKLYSIVWNCQSKSTKKLPKMWVTKIYPVETYVFRSTLHET